jgi:hypothetical protein
MLDLKAIIWLENYLQVERFLHQFCLVLFNYFFKELGKYFVDCVPRSQFPQSGSPGDSLFAFAEDRAFPR